MTAIVASTTSWGRGALNVAVRSRPPQYGEAHRLDANRLDPFTTPEKSLDDGSAPVEFLRGRPRRS
ncbi:MAG: hypothetical protein M9890_06890 [Thermomicrobiales bacterium]|nr:hypothetical protein [Thermomicrobiales bacterium]